jgi:hypothetical protein
MPGKQIKEEAYAVVMKNRLIALYDRHAWAIFSNKADGVAFNREMAARGKKCSVVKCEVTFSLPAKPHKKV